MDKSIVCSECGAILENNKTCQDYFHQMLFWEAENPDYVEVHHLTVISYYLQHPSLYSQDGLERAKKLLKEFVDEGVTPQVAQKRMLAEFASGGNKPKITATDNSKGSYNGHVSWHIKATDVVIKGVEGYCKNVREWSQSIVETLISTGNYENI